MGRAARKVEELPDRRGDVVDVLDDHRQVLGARTAVDGRGPICSARPRMTASGAADLVGDAGGQDADGDHFSARTSWFSRSGPWPAPGHNGAGSPARWRAVAGEERPSPPPPRRWRSDGGGDDPREADCPRLWMAWVEAIQVTTQSPLAGRPSRTRRSPRQGRVPDDGPARRRAEAVNRGRPHVAGNDLAIDDPATRGRFASRPDHAGRIGDEQAGDGQLGPGDGAEQEGRVAGDDDGAASSHGTA